jgi:hypothetical protein
MKVTNDEKDESEEEDEDGGVGCRYSLDDGTNLPNT